MINESEISTNLLFIVDNPEYIESFSNEFLAEGFLVMATNNEYDATKYIVGGGYSLILLDANLRGGEGLKILKWIRWNESEKNLATIPAIMFSGDVDKEIKEQAIKIGALDYVINPKNTPKQIADQIKEILQKIRVS